ncbi:Isoquinoline 1-oxidoreductase subunit [Ruegeria arenilitoris]|uniref:Isoquinoline 1-oxidoreductase subunit n=1 Tax=Ruegeria arenilitoris TaxID=1173585 RepID=UPI00147DA767|nr:Isoquinoline 1-oxidoreductase subunit [Ruegeria arenilitoris]
MKFDIRATALTAAIALTGLLPGGAAQAEEVNGLKTAASFESIESEQARSVAIFEEMAKVITHARCVNCHPVTGGPLQGENQKPHSPPIPRTEDNFGVVAMRCTTCHGEENRPFLGETGSVPGNGHWQLAPQSMGWVGLTVPEICAQLKDPERNGGRTLEEVAHHMGHDTLVGWAWAPGEGREPAPGSWEGFSELAVNWIETGAACPG